MKMGTWLARWLVAIVLYAIPIMPSAAASSAGPRSEVLSASEFLANDCLTLIRENTIYGGFRNSCDFRIGFAWCAYRPKPDAWNASFDCEKKNGISTANSIGPNNSSAHHTAGAEIHWFACRKPESEQQEVRFVSGRLVGKCVPTNDGNAIKPSGETEDTIALPRRRGGGVDLLARAMEQAEEAENDPQARDKAMRAEGERARQESEAILRERERAIEKQRRPNSIRHPTPSSVARGERNTLVKLDPVLLSGKVKIAIADRLNRGKSKTFEVRVGTYYESKSALRSCDNLGFEKSVSCRIKAYRYETDGVEPAFTVNSPQTIGISMRKQSLPNCSYAPQSHNSGGVELVPGELQCRALMLDAIHEAMAFVIEHLEGGENLFRRFGNDSAMPIASTGNCAGDLKSMDTAAAAYRKRDAFPLNSLQSKQLVMYLALNRLRVVEQSCKGQPQYEQAVKLRQVLGDAYWTCRMFQTNKEGCVPRLPF